MDQETGLKRVEIEWIDPTVITDWTESDDIDIDKEMTKTIKSTGYLIDETQSNYLIALSVDIIDGVMKINCAKILPKSVVKSIRNI